MKKLWIALAALAVLPACASKRYTPTVPDALAVGTPQTVFSATTRERDADGYFRFDRSHEVQYLELTVSVPPTHRPGELRFGGRTPDATTEFTMAGRHAFASQQDFLARLNRHLAGRAASESEVVVFVHGFNYTQSEAAFRSAQMAQDMNLAGAMMIYSWPSRGRALGYAYDIDSMMFARDGLEQLLRVVSSSRARRVVVVAHSLGSALTMETLRQIEIRQPGWSRRNLAGVVLISPDIDVELFRKQVAAIRDLPQPFVIFASPKDRALNISGRIRGTADRQRLGSIGNTGDLAGLPIEVIDTSAFVEEAESSHFVVASSPALIAMLNDAEVLSTGVAPEDPTLVEILTGTVQPRNQAVRAGPPQRTGAD
ncbi:alpha/beta hydrolase [Pukyongiella litopenaei]|uniref:Alpha/beta fold hydrolase n=1 Tax=Pukyongiella litopenaei TaxID=2605946 RepID=A0A2S0MSI5_9RHOB|nr:alpha/beta fold hydrolase [Pukyongiella litopenaei]AVO38777.1 alpha/beta fold hydrolase [Pukyongiella litopenaei]